MDRWRLRRSKKVECIGVKGGTRGKSGFLHGIGVEGSAQRISRLQRILQLNFQNQVCPVRVSHWHINFLTFFVWRNTVLNNDKSVVEMDAFRKVGVAHIQVVFEGD